VLVDVIVVVNVVGDDPDDASSERRGRTDMG
jgi:hypothetical protein